MQVGQRIIKEYEHHGERCKFCPKYATDEIVMNDTIHWFLCFEHKCSFDMMLAFQDLIQR